MPKIDRLEDTERFVAVCLAAIYLRYVYAKNERVHSIPLKCKG